MSKYVCSICGYVHDEESGYPEGDISPKTVWADVPASFTCPLCGASKDEFSKKEGVGGESVSSSTAKKPVELPDEITYTTAELSAIFSNLSKGSEKQYDSELSELYKQLASYYETIPKSKGRSDFKDIDSILQKDLSTNFAMANTIANTVKDRGALRALKWSETVTRMINSHLKKVSSGSTDFLENTNINVCDICGFIHIGEEKPEVCPVCKVPGIKMTPIKRGA